MRNLIVTAAIGFAFSTSAMALTTQQELMQSCNTTAEGKKGAARQAHMKSCLSQGKKTAQQEKMKACNIDAQGKKGAERRTFMSKCLKDR